MTVYSCKICNYTTSLKCNYKKHLATKKHKLLCEIQNNDHKVEMNHNEPKMNHNEPEMNQNEPDNNIQDQTFTCEYCEEKFNTKPSMRRHQLHRCKMKPPPQSYKELYEKSEKEKKKLYKKIEELMDKFADKPSQNINTQNITQNTQNNNITLNCYGKEDLGHITGDVLDKLIMGPGTMIGKLTELIHFNENKPENMNVFIPNKRGKYIKSYVDTEWKLENKKVKIDDMVRRNCGIIDEHYCANKEKYSRFNKKNYDIINQGIENDNKLICKNQSDNIETGILNGTDKFKDIFNNFMQ